jgi:pilus assembly protein FimV
MELSPFASMDDTFSSETAVNLDQSDPIAEADFHMAYGLYDQAAGLVNGALESEPERLDLLTKLCEIYFVWGNRDAFVDAARRVQEVAGDDEAGEWDKIVIMGQQIAADDALFAGVGVGGATRAVDLSFDDGSDDAGELDMDFGAAGGQGGEVIDLGGDGEDIFDFSADDQTADGVVDLRGTEETEGEADEGLDFEFGEAPATEKSSVDSGVVDFDFGAEEIGEGSTAEIDLDELDLDLESLRGTGVESSDDFGEFGEEDDDLTANQKILEQTGLNEALEDGTDATGRNPVVDSDATGVRKRVDVEDTVRDEALDIEQLLSETGQIRLAPDETGQNPLLQRVGEADDVDFDGSLLEATGRTHVLTEEFGVETTTSTDDEGDSIIEDAETLLASLEDGEFDASAAGEDDDTVRARTRNEETDFDFAKTEALAADVFTGKMNLDETGEMPAIASTDLDLDLDDLTAALEVSEMGDTVDMPRDDVTLEHVRPGFDDADETSADLTMSLSHEDSSDELHLARTMTEVGTKLDLARAYMDMGDPGGARSILEEVLEEGDESQRQQAQQLLESLPG